MIGPEITETLQVQILAQPLTTRQDIIQVKLLLANKNSSF